MYATLSCQLRESASLAASRTVMAKLTKPPIAPSSCHLQRFRVYIGALYTMNASSNFYYPHTVALFTGRASRPRRLTGAQGACGNKSPNLDTLRSRKQSKVGVFQFYLGLCARRAASLVVVSPPVHPACTSAKYFHCLQELQAYRYLSWISLLFR